MQAKVAPRADDPRRLIHLSRRMESMATHSRRAFARPLVSRVLPAFVALALVGCDDDPTAPANPDGAYEATAWTAIEGGDRKSVV